ncbi:ATP-binding cassette domain-containing protein [Clostridium sardiniense]|uniref:ATP-binding cassette domain-containing protein n=1 Tax=Clostridium sardiniense TaxID=29369 RepID=UPI003C6F7E2E
MEFKNVYFKYPNRDDYALENINLIINKGDCIALVGKNGSGKTTLVKLLTRLYDVTSGDILINGISIKNIDSYSLRRKISTVFQDYLKYELTLRDNIGVANLSSINNDSKLINACKNSGLYDDMTLFQNGFDSQLGVWFPEGTQLSGGQWQKVAISRAFFRNSDLFILDEPSSALDPLSEKLLFDKFLELIDNNIGIFITHRFINAKYAKKIIVLENGKIIESGTHHELIVKQGEYKKLYDIQYNSLNLQNTL